MQERGARDPETEQFTFSDNPDNAEFWKTKDEVDWQKFPTISSRVFEDLMETSEDTACFTYMYEVETSGKQTTNLTRAVLPSKEKVEDPRPTTPSMLRYLKGAAVQMNQNSEYLTSWTRCMNRR